MPACDDEIEIQICPTLLTIKMMDHNEFPKCPHARLLSMFCDVRVCYRLMTVAIKEIQTASTHKIYLRVCSVMLNVFERFRIMKDTHAVCLFLFVCFCCFTSHVNSYGHCGTVSSLNHTFSWAGLSKRLTSNLCTYFRL